MSFRFIFQISDKDDKILKQKVICVFFNNDLNVYLYESSLDELKKLHNPFALLVDGIITEYNY